jgi:hypothetical protein
MKQILLFALCVFIGLPPSSAQGNYKIKQDVRSYPDKFISELTAEPVAQKALPITSQPLNYKPVQTKKGSRDISFISLGQSANAFGYFGSDRTYIWADNHINSVSFIHRMTTFPGSGYLAYDLSTDRGDTWQDNIQVYNSNQTGFSVARYPQGGIYNPAGNTDPDNAYFTYFAPAMDGSNASGDLTWGAYCWGTHKLDDGLLPTQNILTSQGVFHQQIPNGFTLLDNGTMWMIDSDEVTDGAGSYNYNGNLIVGKGVFNSASNDFNFTEELFPLPIKSGDGINDVKVAFSPDGQTGYIMALTTSEEVYFSSYHPILFKTDDGGASWSDPINVELGGPDGIEAIKYWLSDSLLNNFFIPYVPDRDSIVYFAGYDGDLSVDANGNPHIAVMIAIADSDFFYPETNYIAIFHIFSPDGGDTWNASLIKKLRYFSGDFTGGGSTITMYNRPQVATTMDGYILIFSCLDSETPSATSNLYPDIYAMGYSLLTDEYKPLENVTEYTEAWTLAFFGGMSHYIFSEIQGTTAICEIPFVYEEFTTPGNPSQPVQFWYIDNYTMEFDVSGIGINKPVSQVIHVTQNFPNPAKDFTTITVQSESQGNIELEIYNMTGQLITKVTDNNFTGKRSYDIETKNLLPGIYFYTVKSGNDSISKKMIIE